MPSQLGLFWQGKFKLTVLVVSKYVANYTDVQGMLFFYVTRSEYVAIAGKAVSGWNDPHQHVCSPTIDAFVCDENKDVFERFAKELFRHTLPSLHRPDGHILIRNVFISSLLQYLRPFEAFAEGNDPVVQKIRAAAKNVGLSFETLLEWGDMIQQRFDSDNASQCANSKTHPDIVAALQAQSKNVRKLSSELRDTKAGLWAVERRLEEVERNNAKREKRTDAKLDR